MKHLLLFLTLSLAFIPAVSAQEDKVEYVDDEACGCELVFIDGIQTTQDGDRFGFKREDGTIIVPNKFMFVDKFHGEFCKVYMNYDSCGLINRDGAQIIPCEYDEVFYPTDGMIMAVKDSLYGFFDTLGTLRVPFQYRAASSFNEGLAVVAVDIDSSLVSYGYIDHDGRMFIQPQYEYAFPFNEGFAVVKNYDRYGMIDKNNREVFPIKYEILTSMYEGLLFAGDDDGMAMYDNKFRQLTQPVYTQLMGKTGDRILVVRDGKYGFLNAKGKEVIPCQYDYAALLGYHRHRRPSRLAHPVRQQRHPFRGLPVPRWHGTHRKRWKIWLLQPFGPAGRIPLLRQCLPVLRRVSTRALGGLGLYRHRRQFLHQPHFRHGLTFRVGTCRSRLPWRSPQDEHTGSLRQEL